MRTHAVPQGFSKCEITNCPGANCRVPWRSTRVLGKRNLSPDKKDRLSRTRASLKIKKKEEEEGGEKRIAVTRLNRRL